MVPYRHDAVQPLLPFEKRLIAELGIDENDYRRFAAEVARRPYTRSAAYANVPDVRNDGFLVSLAVSLIVGALFTAASYLLTPKPQQADSTKFRTKQLGSKTGKEIFTPSYGFDSLQELAAYGNTVPIVFTRRQTNANYQGTFESGGVVISPALVWSRVKSWGNYQISEVVLIAGQGSMAKPDLAGVYLGNNALDNIFKDYFDFYWNGGFETLGPGSRLRMYNLRYGNLSIDGDRGDQEQAFYAPTRQGASQPAFSGAFTPTNQIRFGVYAGIPNGTPIRPDWDVISIPIDWDNDQKQQAWNTQKKYVDPYLRRTHPYGGFYALQQKLDKAGMPGTGVNYARRVGVIEHKSAATGAITTHTETRNIGEYATEYWTNLVTEVSVEIGDEIVILIGEGRQQKEPFTTESTDIDPPSLDDIRSAVDSELQKIDQEMSLGATFMIGRTTWIVIGRPTDTYNPRVHKTDGFAIRLRCMEAWSENQRKIGIVARSAINRDRFLPYADIDEAYYPILRFEIGSFQNNRKCDVTEIGIKSQVWAKFNGLTNFNTIPTPGQLAKYNGKNIQLRAGKITQYVRRLSTFALDVRPSNAENVRGYNRNEGWTNIGPYLFGVVGDAPIDIYSFIRITHPSRSQLEYRLRPFNSAIFTQQSGGDTDIFILDGGRPGYQSWTFNTYLGTFSVGGRGHFAKPRDYFTHSQMAVEPETDSGESNIDTVVYGQWVPDYTRIDVVLESVICTEAGPSYSVGQPIADNTLSNIMSSFFGDDPYFNGRPEGMRSTKSGWIYDRDPARSIDMALTVEAYIRDIAGTPRNRWWRIVETDVTSFGGEWNDGDRFTKHARNLNGVQFGFTYRVTIPSKYVEYDTPQTATRLFQKYSGIAEVSHYGDYISRSCDSAPEHQVVYVNECLSEDNIPQYSQCAVAGLKLRSSDNFAQLDQLRCYMQNGIEVQRLIDNDIAPSNLLTDLLWYLATNNDTGAGAIINSDLVDRDTLVLTGRYLRANNLYFDDAIAEPINLRSWLAEVAPSVLCYTTLKNGRLAIEPALPYDGAYAIAPNKAIEIKAMFTDGNIIEDSLKIEWLELEDRKMFQAAVLYKVSGLNEIPEQRTVVVRYNNAGSAELPLEEFQFDHITSHAHAVLVARYFLALRKHITHTVTFQTLPWGLALAPGDFIRITTEASPYNPSNNGIVKPDGTVVSVNAIADGDHTVYYWDRSQTQVATGTLQISNGIAQNLRNTVFSTVGSTSTSQVYQVEALDVDTDGIVTVKASNHPVNSSGASLIARDVMDSDGSFEIIGGPIE